MSQEKSRASEKTPVAMARDLLAVANELHAVIVLENAALKAQDYKKVDSLYDRKDALARVYEQHMQSMNANPAFLKTLPKSEQDKLRAIAEKLKAAGDENITRLRGHIKVTQQIVDTVAQTVRAESPMTAVTGFYSSSGTTGEIKAPSSSSSILLNDTF